MDLILRGGNVITMRLSNTREQAIAIKDGRIAATGSSRSISQLATSGCRVVDLDGRTVLPGFVDSHVHLFLTGVSLGAAQLGTASTVAEVCERLRENATSAAPGAWVYGMACLPAVLREGRFPTLAELDKAVPNNPVYIAAVTFHSGATNSLGLRLIDPDPAMPGVEIDDPGIGYNAKSSNGPGVLDRVAAVVGQRRIEP